MAIKNTARAAVATVTTKGQITIPASIRVAMDLRPGSRLRFYPQGNGFGIATESDPLDELRGSIPYSGPKVGIRDMDDAMDAELGQRWGRH
jgi:AbrB family looped-hinge helix DNA binding protein